MPIDTLVPEITDVDATIEEVCRSIRTAVEEANADGVVLALGGDVGSTVTARIAVEALGSGAVYGLILPLSDAGDVNRGDARHVAEELVIDHRVVELQPSLDAVIGALTKDTRESSYRTDRSSGSYRVTVDPVSERVDYRDAVAAAVGRLRALALSFEADTRDLLVLGTGDRTDRLLGRHAERGDDRADLLPLGDLYATQVRALAAHLDVRDSVLEAPSERWEEPIDGADWENPDEVIDAALVETVDRDRSIAEAADRLDCDPDVVRTIDDWRRRTTHERRQPTAPAVHTRDEGSGSD
jgi:NAD+ synthase